MEALRRNNLIKVLSEPTLTTVSGRAASFNVGGEFPIIVPQSLGTVSVEYRQFGTRVDFIPIVHSNGNIRLEVRPQVSEIDSSRSITVQNTTVPGLRSRWVDTAAELRAGQTLALAGLLQNRIESETRTLPVLGDLPWVGAAFRRVEEANNEVELLILVTPELAEPMDAHEVPRCGPGQMTASPTDCELYGRGYIEVPRCCPEGADTGGSVHYPGGVIESPGTPIPSGQAAPLGRAPGIRNPPGTPAPNGSAAGGRYRQQPAFQVRGARRPATTAALPRQLRAKLPDGSRGPATQPPAPIAHVSRGLIGPSGYDAID